EDKRKFIVYTIFGIISIGVIAIGFSFAGGKNSSNKEVSTLDIPLSSEKEQYETRLQALQKFDTVKADPNQRMTQFFARKKADGLQKKKDSFNRRISKRAINTGYEPIHQQIVNTVPVQTSNYNRYGSSSMWQVEEPQNSNIGYSSASYVKNRTQQIEKRTTVQ